MLDMRTAEKSTDILLDVCRMHIKQVNDHIVLLVVPECSVDEKLEELWEEFEDVTCIESKDFYKDDEDYKDNISLVIASDWQNFKAGTNIELIWHWFDQNHSKGVEWLMNKYEIDAEIDAGSVDNEEITKQMIKKGFEQNVISIENEFEGCIDLCCRIGDNAFYFSGKCEGMTAEQYWDVYTLDMAVDMIHECLKDVKSADENGLGENEFAYYKIILLELSNNGSTAESDFKKRCYNGMDGRC